MEEYLMAIAKFLFAIGFFVALILAGKWWFISRHFNNTFKTETQIFNEKYLPDYFSEEQINSKIVDIAYGDNSSYSDGDRKIAHRLLKLRRDIKS